MFASHEYMFPRMAANPFSEYQGRCAMKMREKNGFIVRPAALPPGQSGVLLSVTPEEAGWKTIGFSVRRLAEGDVWSGSTGDHEVAIVVLGGRLTIDWGSGPQAIGKRENVFAGFPYAVHLPCLTSFEVRAKTIVELAESRVASHMKLNPRIFAPQDLDYEIRGGGNTTRQIVRIIRPETEADKLMMNEVYTPGGNWSSYPPHKHDTDNPPKECNLDEIYYFRIDHPDGFALLRQYHSAGTQDILATIRDGDLAPLRKGYHLVAVPPGYRVYYLAVLAGSACSLAASTDPRYLHLSKAEPAPDPRVPVVTSE
jgi:5-deoxy-glucuronate isomerase